MIFIKSKKSYLYYTRLILFWVVTSERCPSRGLCARAHIQDCSGSESLTTCGRFDRFVIQTRYLSHQKRTSYKLVQPCGMMMIFIISFLLEIIKELTKKRRQNLLLFSSVYIFIYLFSVHT